MEIVRLLFRVLVTLETSYQVYLQTGEFPGLLGPDKDIVTATSYGTKLPDMTRSVDNIFINLIPSNISIKRKVVKSWRVKAHFNEVSSNLQLLHYSFWIPNKLHSIYLVIYWSLAWTGPYLIMFCDNKFRFSRIASRIGLDVFTTISTLKRKAHGWSEGKFLSFFYISVRN